MPIKYRFEPKHSAILVEASGNLTLKDILDHLASMASDPQIPADHVTLFDATEVTSVELKMEEMSEISGYTESHPSNKIVANKLAIVTAGSETTRLAEEYERLASKFGETVITFCHRDIACKWLGVPDGV